MWKTSLKLIIVLFFNPNVYALKIKNPHNPVHHLSNLVSDKNNKPLIVVVDTKPQRSSDFDDLLISGDDGVLEDDQHHQNSAAGDDAAYILYHLLRTTKQDDSPDPLLEETKEALRQAIRIKCKRVEECVIECPVKQRQCPRNCQKVYDNLNLCSPPRPKKNSCRPKCGRTMPPKWFF